MPRLLILALVGASFGLVLSACGGKSESLDGDGASGDGASGDGGAGGANGGVSGSNSGATGASGSGGRGGTSGTSSGGASGASGSGGRGGTSGSSTGGTSGTSGTAGSGGDGGFGGVPSCEYVPVAVLCVRGTPSGENEVLEPGDHLRIEVRPGGCYSSSCTEAAISACSVLGSGPFEVQGQFCLASTGNPDIGCNADCGGGGFAACESGEPLEAGDYTVTLGSLSVSFSVPGTLHPGESCDGSQF